MASLKIVSRVQLGVDPKSNRLCTSNAENQVNKGKRLKTLLMRTMLILICILNGILMKLISCRKMKPSIDISSITDRKYVIRNLIHLVITQWYRNVSFMKETLLNDIEA